MTKAKKKAAWGGARKGAGRPPVVGEEGTVRTLRVALGELHDAEVVQLAAEQRCAQSEVVRRFLEGSAARRNRASGGGSGGGSETRSFP